MLHMRILANIISSLSKMQQDLNANCEDIVIEMSLKKFRSIHEPKPMFAHTNELPTLNLPPLPQPDLVSLSHSTTSPTLPHTASASKSRERRSNNTVFSQVQGAFKVNSEEMMSGGVDRANFKRLIDNHMKKLNGNTSIKNAECFQPIAHLQILR